MILGIFTYFNNAFIQKSRLSLTWKKARNIGSMNDGWYISLPRTVARCKFWDRQCEEIKSKGKDAWWSLDKRIISLKEKWRGGSGGFFFFFQHNTLIRSRSHLPREGQCHPGYLVHQRTKSPKLENKFILFQFDYVTDACACVGMQMCSSDYDLVCIPLKSRCWHLVSFFIPLYCIHWDMTFAEPRVYSHSSSLVRQLAWEPPVQSPKYWV